MQTMASDTPAAQHGDAGCLRVSVIAACFNGEAFLAEAIESVICQTFNDWEFLLVDDGSVDGSAAIAKDYAKRYPEKIHYFEHPGHANRGTCASRNLGILHARGEYIAVLDADDVWMPSKLADQVAILNTHPDVGMVCGAAVYWSSWSGGEDRIAPSGHTQDCVVTPPESSLKLYPLGHGTAPCPSDFLLRTTIVRELGGFEEHFIGHNQLYEDQAFLAKLYLKSPIYIASNIWLKYRLHDKSCVASVMRAGNYHAVRQYFLNWFEGYVVAIPELDGRIVAAIHRAQRRNRHPQIDFFLTLPSEIPRLYRRLRGVIGRRTRRMAVLKAVDPHRSPR
jgi:glycosyltransferase involved in cell wall biosynthesis